MSTEFEGRNSLTPDRLDTETGRLVPVEQRDSESPPTTVYDQNVFDSKDSETRTFSPSQSPTPTPKAEPQPTSQWFGDVIEDLLDGRQVRRLSWPEGECVYFGTAFIQKEDNSGAPFECLLHRRDDVVRPWAIARQDLENADDWVVVSENAGSKESEDKMYHPQS